MKNRSVAAERVYGELVEHQRRGEACALVLLVEVKGSAPARPGAKMAVFADGRIVGTVGGGGMEKEAAELALQAMETGEAGLHHVDLAKPPEYVCGGRATLYIEPVLPASGLLIAGAGHVGQALCRTAAGVGFQVTVVDDREEFADPALLPEAAKVVCCRFAEMFERLPVSSSTFIVCATRGHAHDYTVVGEALATEAAYIGLVGSRGKRATFFRRLEEERGVSAADLARIYTPVGLDIGAATPAEIAISITAELIQVRNGKTAAKGNGPSGGWQLAASPFSKAHAGAGG